MATATLVPCLAQLRAEINQVAPNRDKTSDGTIGDEAHQATVSDHNDDEVGRVPIKDADSKHEIHAYDADADLNESDLTMRKIVDHILARCRAGLEKRLRYIIFDGMIWEASNSWRKRAYTGANKHRQHAHFSASYDTRHEADTSSWHLEEIPIMLTTADKKWLADQIDRSATAAAERVWRAKRNVNVGPRAKDPKTGKARPTSDQETGNILSHLSPEVAQIRDEVRGVAAAIAEIRANLPTSAD